MPLAREGRLRRKLTEQLLHDLHEADVAMRLGKRGAPLAALAQVLSFVVHLAELDRNLGRSSGLAPGMALFRLAHALVGLTEGTIDPILVPNKERRRRVVDMAEDKYRGIRTGHTSNVLYGRATAAAAMTILMLAGRKREAAAREVAKVLLSTPLLADSKGEPWRVVAHWREEIVKRAKEEMPGIQGQVVDLRTEAAKHFSDLVSEAQHAKQAGVPPEALVAFAHHHLDHGLGMGEDRNPGLARAKSGSS